MGGIALSILYMLISFNHHENLMSQMIFMSILQIKFREAR